MYNGFVNPMKLDGMKDELYNVLKRVLVYGHGKKVKWV